MAEKYINGKGKLYFAPFASGSQTPTLERYVGNAPEVAITFESQYLDHYASTGGIKQKDQSIAIQVNRSGNARIDSIQMDNLAAFFFGSTSEVSQAAGSVTNEAHVIDKLDRYVQLGADASNPVGAHSVSAVIVSNGATTFVDGTDYILDAARGRLYIPKTSSIVAGSSVDVDYTKAAKKRDMVISGSTPIEGALRFVADNPAGENLDYYMPWVKLTPNGDFNLISDEWLSMAFQIEVLKKSDVEAVYINGQPF